MPLLRTLDFTRSLPAGCTFTRAGGRLALQNGELVNLTPNTPAFESTDLVDLGLSIQKASTNLVLTITPDVQMFTVTPTLNSLTGVSDADVIAETGESNAFQRINHIMPNLTTGQRFCFSLYVAPDAGSEDSLFGLILTNQYNNGGVTSTFRNDGVEGISLFKDDSLYGDTKVGFERCNSDWVRYWVTGTKQSDSWGSMELRTLDWTLASPNTTPNPLHKIKIFGFQLELDKERPSSYMPTLSDDTVDDELKITDLTGLNASQGTIVIEHDVRDGDLLSVSGTPIVSAAIPGKTAVAWSGSDSSISNNGSNAETGPAFSISSAVDVLANSSGHIKSIQIYDERLSDADLKAVTAKPSKAKAGVYRIASTHNRLPVALNAPSVGFRHYARFPFKVTHDCSAIKLAFNNWVATTTGDNLGSEVTVHKCALEYGGSHVPVTFGGQESIVLDAGASDITSDNAGPIPAGTEGFIRVQVSGDTVPCARWRFETGAYAYFYNPATVTVPDVYGTGDITHTSGGGIQFEPHGACPIMIGISARAGLDPLASFVVGDSLVEGTNDLIPTGTFMVKAAAATDTPLLLHAVGGEHHYHRDASTRWRASLKYCRVLFDNMYANNIRGLYGAVHSIYYDAKSQGIENIYRVETFPAGGSNDNWATDQSNITPRPNQADVNAFEWGDSGYIDGVLPVDGIVDLATDGWVMNGTEFYMTVDGTHQTPVSDDIVAANAQTLLESITLNQPTISGVDILLPESPINKSHIVNGDGTTFGLQFSCVFDVKSNIKQD